MLSSSFLDICVLELQQRGVDPNYDLSIGESSKWLSVLVTWHVYVGFRILEFAEKNILFDCSKLCYFIAFTKWKENNIPMLYKPITWQLE
jgi:hypothetical protein